jgi:pimeloyl-ACP methyl ester carboxylesterase
MIQGHQDEYGTAAQLDAIAEKTPDTTTVMLDRCGHSPHRDQAEATLDAIVRFLAQKDPLP